MGNVKIQIVFTLMKKKLNNAIGMKGDIASMVQIVYIAIKSQTKFAKIILMDFAC